VETVLGGTVPWPDEQYLLTLSLSSTLDRYYSVQQAVSSDDSGDDSSSGTSAGTAEASGEQQTKVKSAIVYDSTAGKLRYEGKAATYLVHESPPRRRQTTLTGGIVQEKATVAGSAAAAPVTIKTERSPSTVSRGRSEAKDKKQKKKDKKTKHKKDKKIKKEKKHGKDKRRHGKQEASNDKNEKNAWTSRRRSRLDPKATAMIIAEVMKYNAENRLRRDSIPPRPWFEGIATSMSKQNGFDFLTAEGLRSYVRKWASQPGENLD
jgi:hypothetical protein